MKPEYGSDVVADLLKQLDIDYIALNPGSTFRGLHESVVNYGGNKNPEVILCCHEQIAVSLAQGYAKAALKPMAAAVHNVVGLLHSTMSIYINWLDQTPVLVLGGTGPMAAEKRRPWIDWIHTALIQGTVVRDYVKWDDQPASIDSLAESFYRGYRAAVSDPKGPVYICLDAALQEQRVDKDFILPEFDRYPVSVAPQAHPEALQRVATLLVEAERPVVMADYFGKNPEAVASLIELAELLALPVIDVGARFNFPNTHPLSLSSGGGSAASYAKESPAAASSPEDELLSEADVILGLDVNDFYQVLHRTDRTTRLPRAIVPETAKIIHIGLKELRLRSWSQDFGRLQPMDLSITADTSVALPSLIALCRQALTDGDPIDRKQRFAKLQTRHQSLRKEWQQTAKQMEPDKPISLAHLAAELWKVVKNDDWVLTNRTLRGWTRRLWDWTSPHQWVSGEGGGGLGHGVGHSIGAALAHKGTGRLCIDIQPDGDFLFTPSALWTAAHHRIPLLVVMYNNRSYYNSENHQRVISEARGRPTATKGIGTQIVDPPVNFSTLARSFGFHSEGPIEEPDDLEPALERAVRRVQENGSCALVDVITQPR